MESAPQSTIAHNAVIEFASDAVLPSADHRGVAAGAQKRSPAQKDGLNSGATMPKSHWRRNAANGLNGRFSKGFSAGRRGIRRDDPR
jgi:hypothetical protein